MATELQKLVEKRKEERGDVHFFLSNEVPAASAMQNPGWLCWMNSLLQMLFSISSLNHILLQPEMINRFMKINEKTGKPNMFALAYISELKKLMDAAQDDTMNVQIGEKHRISSRLWPLFYEQCTEMGRENFAYGRQACSSDAFNEILEHFNQPEVFDLFKMNVENITICPNPKCRKPAFDKDIETMYVYKIQTRLHLDTPTKFRDWIIYNDAPHSFDHCGKCNLPSEIARRQTYARFVSSVIVVNLKSAGVRPDYPYPKSISFDYPKKPNDPLHPPEINFRTDYALVAIVCHMGGPNGGHYYSHFKRGDMCYTGNDSRINRIAELPLNDKNAYLLTYQKVLTDVSP